VGVGAAAVPLPTSLADFGPAAVAAVIAAAYLVVGEPVAGHVLHRRFEGRLRTDPRARRSFYRRLLVLEWGLTAVVAVVIAAAPRVPLAALGLRWPDRWPGPVTWTAVLVVVVLVLLSTRTLRGGALLHAQQAARRPGEGRHSEPPVHSTLALLPRTRRERHLFTVVGLTAGLCEEWLYRGFFLAVLSALAGGLPTIALVLLAAAAFGLAHAYQGPVGMLTTGVLGGVLAALYLQTGSLLLPVLLHAAIDLRFLLVPARALPTARRAVA
jgi:membrane protease YdiL (CAAX protease family)